MSADPRALVVGDGDSRGALAGARALASAGWRVGVASATPHGLAWSSRYVAHRHRVTSPGQDPAAHAADVLALAASHGYDAVLPAGDAELLALSAHRDGLGTRLPLAPHASILRALDKLELTRAAQASGLDVPLTWGPADPWPTVAADGPVVVKPRLHFDPARRGQPQRRETRVARDPEEARAHAAAMTADGVPVVLQEYVEGRLSAVSFVLDADGRALAAVRQEAWHTWPPRGGVTARGRTLPADPELVERASDLLRRLGWIGLCQLQLLVPDDRPPCLIDLNGRLFGSLAGVVGAGVNLPALWAGMARGGAGTAEPAPATGRPGTVYQWMVGDLRHALTRDRPVRAVAEVLRVARRAHHSVLRPGDPGPALRYCLLLARRLRRAAG